MSRKTKNKRSNQPRNRGTRTDFKLYARYHSREAAEADASRLIAKAAAMIDETAAPLVSGLRHQREPAVAIQPAGEDTSQAKPGTDYQSIIISKQRATKTAEWFYMQEKGGELTKTGYTGLHVADDPGGMPHIDRAPDPEPVHYPLDYVPNLPEIDPTRHDYEPLQGPDGKRDRARRFINPTTGEIISRRAHMRLSGIIPEVKKADRRPPKKPTGEEYVTIVSYGVMTNDTD